VECGLWNGMSSRFGDRSCSAIRIWLFRAAWKLVMLVMSWRPGHACPHKVTWNVHALQDVGQGRMWGNWGIRGIESRTKTSAGCHWLEILLGYLIIIEPASAGNTSSPPPVPVPSAPISSWGGTAP
jgi:hypothetical protein